MQLTNSYYWFRSAIDPETCKKIIDLGETRLAEETAKGHNVEAYTFGDEQKGAKPNASPKGELTSQELLNTEIKDHYVRDSKVTWLNDQWLYDLFHPYIASANKLAGWDWQWDFSESFQFTVYDPTGFYSWHKDGASDSIGSYRRYIYGVTPVDLRPNGRVPDGYITNSNLVGKNRKISMTCNLNVPGDYEGGNLKFDFGHHTNGERFHECEEIRPQGSIIVFPSFVDHCVTPITKGKRYSLVLWTCGDPFK